MTVQATPASTTSTMTCTMTCTAFAGMDRIATGDLEQVALVVKAHADRDPRPILIFDDATSDPVELDLRGTAADVRARLDPDRLPPSPPQAAARGPGRPKLGVTPREVTLLPRHWDWLNAQPGGASVALRRLVEEARKVHAGRDRARRAQEVAYRFMSALAGNLTGYEEAMRALFAGDRDRFMALIDSWPGDVRTHTAKLAEPAFSPAP